MTDNPQTTNSDDWLAGYHQALEDSATLVETHLVYPYCATKLQPITKGRATKGNQPRHVYAEAIRAMKETGL